MLFHGGGCPRATNERRKGLAPALIQTAEMDVLRDDGLTRDYGLLNAISHVPAVHSALLQASKELKT